MDKDKLENKKIIINIAILNFQLKLLVNILITKDIVKTMNKTIKSKTVKFFQIVNVLSANFLFCNIIISHFH